MRSRQDKPVPGKPAFKKVPLRAMVRLKPRGPIEVLTPEPLMLRRTPGMIVMRLEKRNPMNSSLILKGRDIYPGQRSAVQVRPAM
jgi:hypothetical protein